MAGEFEIEVLSSAHDRDGFSSGVDALDRYLRTQASQDVRRRASICYVAVETAGGRVAGYYTLSAAGILLDQLPASLAKRLPRYPHVPVARVGRLAVDREYRGRGLGSVLLWDAAERALRSEVAIFGLLVEAKDEEAERFYQHHGFVQVGPAQLILPLETIAGV